MYASYLSSGCSHLSFLVLGGFAAALKPDTTAQAAQRAESAQVEGSLQLHQLSTEFVSGTFTPAKQESMSFEAKGNTSGGSFWIRQGTVTVLDYRVDENTVSLTTMNGKAGWTAIRPLLSRLADPEDAMDEAERGRITARAVREHGDPALFEQLSASDTGLSTIRCSGPKLRGAI